MDELTLEYKEIESKLSAIVDVIPFEVDIHLAFSLTFARIFVADTPNYQLADGTIGATRSNWTYHTAFAIAQTSKMFNLICKFECYGKRDAIIETIDDNPEVLLIAEWEWDYEDIFGKGKELEKLRDSCKKHKTAVAFLLVYCSKQKYPDYLFRITNFWVNAFKRFKKPPVLYLHTIIFEEAKTIREFQRFKTVVIGSTEIIIISDIDF